MGGSPGWPSRAAGKAHLSTRLMEGGRDGRGEAVTRRADMQQQQHSAAQDKHRPPRRHGKMSGRRGEEQHSGCMTGEGYRLGARQARASAQLCEHRHCHRPLGAPPMEHAKYSLREFYGRVANIGQHALRARNAPVTYYGARKPCYWHVASYWASNVARNPPV